MKRVPGDDAVAQPKSQLPTKTAEVFERQHSSSDESDNRHQLMETRKDVSRLICL